MKDKFGLTGTQKKILLEILSPFSEYIDQVGVFGSRATGKYKINSDLDLVLYGNVPENIADRLYSLFMESMLSISVDIQIYNFIKSPLLKEHIDKVSIVLFEQKHLKNNNYS